METINLKQNSKRDNLCKIIELLIQSIKLSKALNTPEGYIKSLEEKLRFQEEQLDKIETNKQTVKNEKQIN